MSASPSISSRAKNPTLAAILALIVPGAGQIYAGKLWRGITLLLLTPLFAYLVYWGWDNFQTGKIILGATMTSWLWLPFILFWLWNVLDARQSLSAHNAYTWIGLVLAGVILYYLAWNVTDVKFDRLISRFNDATKVATALVNPDLFSREGEEEPARCSWDCIWAYLSGDPTIVNFQLSDNFGDIFGRMVPTPAPDWLVNLGWAVKGQKIPTYKPGTLIETIAIGLLATIFSTILAIPLSFFAAHNIMQRIPGGSAIYYVMRTLLNIVRAVDTVIWGLLIIVWVGLGNFAGIIALTIHSIAALGKLYSEEIEHIDMGPVEAITAAGGNLLQVVRYAVIPQIVPPFLAYTLLRWDINMRSATIVGFVAGGGIGFFVLETIRKGAYQQYAAALWAVALVIILVEWVSTRWRERILVGHVSARRVQTQAQQSIVGQTISGIVPVNKNKSADAIEPSAQVSAVAESDIIQAPQPFYKSPLKIFYVILGVIAFGYCWWITKIDLRTLFDPAPTFSRLLRDFITIDMTPMIVDTVVYQMIITTFQAFLATTFGAIIAIPFSFLAAHNLTGRSRLSIWLYYFMRGLFSVLRSIEALLYVAIFVFWVGIGPFAGTLALAITTFALIGKLYADAIENIDMGPMEAITATGANRLQAIMYAILPQIIPPFISYSIYQWDINVRMATIIGFAGGGGIGLLLNTYFGQLQYHKAGTVVALIVLVVAVMDFASAKIREQMV